MGDFTLGCLLGQYDKAQSFDVDSFANPTNINSWSLSVGSLDFQFTQINSSKQSIRYLVGSRTSENNAIIYNYAKDDDAFKKWFPDVTTHAMAINFWGINENAVDNVFYQDFFNEPGESDLFIPRSFSHLFQSVTSVTSGTNRPIVRFVRTGELDTDSTLSLDDVLTTIDPIILHPEYSFLEQARTIQTQHRSIGGEYRISVWEKYFAYSIPLRFLSDSHADLINWWWENKFNLLFTLNTSDSESMYITQIVNQQQPIGKRIRPYNDLWEGVIQLESIDKGSLVF